MISPLSYCSFLLIKGYVKNLSSCHNYAKTHQNLHCQQQVFVHDLAKTGQSGDKRMFLIALAFSNLPEIINPRRGKWGLVLVMDTSYCQEIDAQFAGDREKVKVKTI